MICRKKKKNRCENISTEGSFNLFCDTNVLSSLGCVFIRVDMSRVSVLSVECILRPFDIVDRYRLGAVRCR